MSVLLWFYLSSAGGKKLIKRRMWFHVSHPSVLGSSLMGSCCFHKKYCSFAKWVYWCFIFINWSFVTRQNKWGQSR